MILSTGCDQPDSGGKVVRALPRSPKCTAFSPSMHTLVKQYDQAMLRKTFPHAEIGLNSIRVRAYHDAFVCPMHGRAMVEVQTLIHYSLYQCPLCRVPTQLGLTIPDALRWANLNQGVPPNQHGIYPQGEDPLKASPEPQPVC